MLSLRWVCNWPMTGFIDNGFLKNNTVVSTGSTCRWVHVCSSVLYVKTKVNVYITQYVTQYGVVGALRPTF